ncbi:MAG: MogA/MoaB family molybdenum cofactor biosynthesis protein [Elusimicrobia bacterium]|nr:MogA/MoaB family molybdenum cofactor biosynthesis protein [Elusimicrobiota bacterium]
MTAGILTASDRCSSGASLDLSGPALRELVEARGWKVTAAAVLPDDAERIAATLRDWCDRKNISLILTTGGTGIGPRDVTPEATRRTLEKELPGVAELMRREGLRHTRMAVLSRALVGVRGSSLIVNLPGSPSGARESLEAVIDLVEHALAILKGGGHEKTAGDAA